MRKILIVMIVLITVLLGVTVKVYALKGRVATAEDVKMLKKDVLLGKVKIGKTRLKQIRELYGDPGNINETDSRITYDYGNLRLVMDKMKYLRKWEYDSSGGYVYTDAVEDLRFDLEDGQIVGDFVSYDSIRKSYGEPTKASVTNEDGMMSTYYYGQIKLTFENIIVVNSWKGSGLQDAVNSGVISDGVLGAGISTNE